MEGGEADWLQSTSKQRVRGREMRKERLNKIIADRKRLEAERLARGDRVAQPQPSRLVRSYRTFKVKAEVCARPSLDGASVTCVAHYLSSTDQLPSLFHSQPKWEEFKARLKETARSEMMIVSLATSEREAGSVTIAQCVQVNTIKEYKTTAKAKVAT